MENQKTASPPRNFGSEFLFYWQQLPHKGFFFVLLAAWLMLFQFLGNSTFGYVDTPSLFHWMANAYSAPRSASFYAKDC